MNTASVQLCVKPGTQKRGRNAGNAGNGGSVTSDTSITEPNHFVQNISQFVQKVTFERTFDEFQTKSLLKLEILQKLLLFFS